MIYLLDTNICIYIINAKPFHVLEKFRQQEPGTIALSTVSAAELAYGVIKSGSERNQRALQMFFAPLEILSFDERAVWRYGVVRASLEQSGQPIGALDTMIAAHALSIDATLVTNNEREFRRVRGLKIENWV
ncbi:MAG: type II toxin-antitoxin system VapC family toxin [Actinobacteria bacterium]|jgi:tRNA(fMet)-specific endonuclease VapC|nr:type II toxin-antitoxin system VapC family toxin [Actinomycetota bacterium]